jgi:hypothetical protein
LLRISMNACIIIFQTVKRSSSYEESEGACNSQSFDMP